MKKISMVSYENCSEQTRASINRVMAKYPELFTGQNKYGIDNIDRIAADLDAVRVNPFFSLSINMTGKMEKMCSLSGAVQGDRTCRARIESAIKKIRAFSPAASNLLDRYLLPSKDPRHITGKKLAEKLTGMGCPVCICVLCYADAAQSWQDDTRNKFVANSIYYSEKLLDNCELPTVYGYNNVFRLSAENDAGDIITARNYIRLCNKPENSNITFAIWTKNPGILYNAIKAENGKPKNLIIILSSLNVNETDLELYNRYIGIIDYVFTVLTADYAKAHNITLNCCGADPGEKRKCYECMHCYTFGNCVFVYEILR